MAPRRRSWLSTPWYPLLFGAYPALALLASNVGEVGPAAATRAVVTGILMAGALVLVLRRFAGSPNGAAFLTTLLLALFFSYGHAYLLLLARIQFAELALPLITVWFLLAVGAVFWSRTHPPEPLSLNLVVTALVAASVFQIARGSSHPRVDHRPPVENAPVRATLRLPESAPDVYYFILDSYARSDLLQAAYGYDNGPFIAALEERGFYVASCSQSNYVRTELSMASSLNMTYLQDLDSSFQAESTKRRLLWDALQHNAVRYLLEELGYKTVAFATGYAWNELKDADYYYSPPPLSSGLTEFEALLIQTTFARHLSDLGILDPDEVTAQNYRDRFNLIFDSVSQIAEMPGLTFAHIHVISPHPPFVFDALGNPTHPADFWNAKRLYPAPLYAKGLVNQTAYVNSKVLQAIDEILSRSETEPVIILQGDHGPWLQTKEKRMRILNAYYLPDGTTALYPSISPVNSFRVVLNEVFDGDYDMLADISYFSPVPDLYDFSVVPYPCTD